MSSSVLIAPPTSAITVHDACTASQTAACGAYVTAKHRRGWLCSDFVRTIGADEIINYETAHFEDVVKDVDAVIDLVGGDLVERSLNVIKPGGIYVTVAGRVTPDMGAARGLRTENAGRADSAALKQIDELIESGKFQPKVQTVFSLAQARTRL
jgi:NADPH:quinone reductase-like Zn-dependent oxidoreductase